ncbi:MAG: hypothetical protein P4L33_16415 [Capsulimonadaceae bacterium]|nr:hypothetical protein [Capsulimonadaceae bacterium]
MKSISRGFALNCATALILAMAIAVTAGCGGGGGGGGGGKNSGGGNTTLVTGDGVGTGNAGTGNGTSTAAVNTAVTNLNSVIANPSSSASTLSSTVTTLAKAVQSDPTSANAQALFAVADSALVAQNLANQVGVSLVRKANAKQATSGVASLTSNLFIWNLTSTVGAGASPAPAVSDIVSQITAPNASTIETYVINHLSDFQAIQLALSALPSNYVSTYTFTVPATSTTAARQASIGVTELGALDAAISTLVAVADIYQAYNYTITGYDTTTPIMTTYAAKFASGGTIFPTDYFPAAPFGQLTSSGATLMANALANLKRVGNVATLGLNNLKSRVDSGATNYLIPSPGITITDADIAKALTAVALYQSYLNGTVTATWTGIGGNGGPTAQVAINVSALFTNPVTDWRNEFPSLTVLSASQGGPGITVSVANYPDLTLHGLFPNGLSSTITSTVRASTYPVAANTTIGDIISLIAAGSSGSTYTTEAIVQGYIVHSDGSAATGYRVTYNNEWVVLSDNSGWFDLDIPVAGLVANAPVSITNSSGTVVYTTTANLTNGYEWAGSITVP